MKNPDKTQGCLPFETALYLFKFQKIILQVMK